jgi:hypothetical protein
VKHRALTLQPPRGDIPGFCDIGRRAAQRH